MSSGPPENDPQELGDSGDAPRRPRRRALRLLVWLAVFVLLALTLVLTLGKPVLEEAAREQIVRTAAEALGTSVTVESLDIDLLPLRLRAAGLRVDGTDGEPALTLEEAVVSLSLRPLLRRELVIDQVELEAPRVALRFDAEGRHNLPLPRRGGGGQGGFEVSLGSVIVRRGELVLNDRRVPLEIATGSFGSQVSPRADGTARTELSLADVRLAGPDGGSSFDLEATLDVGSGRVELDRARLEGEQIGADVTGGWSSARGLALDARGALDVSFLRELGWMPLDLEGSFDFVGALEVEGGTLGYRVDLSSAQARVFERDLRTVTAELVGTASRVSIGFEGAAYGGDLDGRAEVELGDRSHLDLELDARGLELSRLIDAEVDLGVDWRWRVLAGDVRARFEYETDLGETQAALGRGTFTVEPNPGEVPVTAVLPFELRGSILSSEAVDVRTEGAQVDGDLAIDLSDRSTTGRLRLASGSVLALGRESLALLGGSLPDSWPSQGELAADLGLETVDGTLGVQIDGTLTGLAEGLEVDRVELSSWLHEGVLRDLEVRARRGDGRLSVSGELPLSAPTRVDQIAALEGEVQSWPLASLAPGSELAGILDGSLTPAGEGVALEARLRGLERRVGDDLLRLDSALDFRALLTPERIAVERLRSVGGGRLDGRGTWEVASGALQAQLEMNELELVRVADGAASTYRFSGSVAVGGQPTDPEVRADVRGLTGEGREIAWLRGAWMDGRGNFSGRAPGLGDLVVVSQSSTDGSTVSIEVPEVEWAELLSQWPGAPTWLAEIEARSSWSATVELPRSAAPSAVLTAPVVDVTVSGTQLSLLEPARVTWREGRVEIESFFLESADASSEVFLVGDATFGRDDSAGLDLRVQASGPAHWLDALELPVEVEGRMELLATVQGKTDEPVLDGVAALRNGSLRTPDFPYGAEEADVVVLLYPDRAVIDRGVAQLAGGTVRVEGEVGLPDLETRLRGSISEARFNYPDDWSIVGGADLTLLSQGTGPVQLRGQVRLDQVRYDQDFARGLGALLRTLFEPSAERVATARQSSMDIDLDVRGDRALQIENNIANLQGDFALRVRGDPLSPRLFGDIDLRPGGRLDYGGEQYVIQRGRLAFDSPYSNEPQIDIAATTKRLDYTVSLTLSGTRDRLQASLTSDPPLPELDVWSLLASGDVGGSAGAADGLGRNQLDRSSVGAEALLYGQASSLVEDRVSRLFGLDRFRLNPIASGDSLSSARVTVGKRFSRDIFVTYSVDPNSTDDGVVEVEWRLTDRLVLVLSQNADGSYSAVARMEQVF